MTEVQVSSFSKSGLRSAPETLSIDEAVKKYLGGRKLIQAKSSGGFVLNPGFALAG